MKYRKLQATRYTLFHELCADPINPLPQSWQRTQLTSMWDGLAQLEAGKAPGPEDWRCVSDAVNLLETLITQGEVEDTKGLLSDAITALAQAGQRHKAGPGSQAVRARHAGCQSCAGGLRGSYGCSASENHDPVPQADREKTHGDIGWQKTGA